MRTTTCSCSHEAENGVKETEIVTFKKCVNLLQSPRIKTNFLSSTAFHPNPQICFGKRQDECLHNMGVYFVHCL